MKPDLTCVPIAWGPPTPRPPLPTLTLVEKFLSAPFWQPSVEEGTIYHQSVQDLLTLKGYLHCSYLYNGHD